ncbi:hypothetical protein ACFL2Z_01055 [Candidatus Eisenbacteria bacterium]|uniref:Uncharacterized protein n=1 Tax=Eiseniibacteriota bacterium TaxID=2212470 RepID=A0ABV6YN36_UNCEI
MTFPSDEYRRRKDPDMVESDLKALGDQSNQHLPTIDQTAQALWKHNQRRSREGSLMKALHSLKTHPAMTTVLGIAVVAAVLLAVPISYTRTTGYQATLEIADASGVDLDAIAGEFGKALDTEDVIVMAGFGGGGRIFARLPVRSAGTLEIITSSFAQALTDKGVRASAEVEPVTEQVTGNVYAAAANEIVEIKVSSEGLTDEEIEDEIRAQIEAAGFDACLVDVETGDGEKRIEIGLQCDPEKVNAENPCPISISIDGMEPPPAGDCAGQRVMELRLVDAGQTLEEVEAEARELLDGMGFDDAAEIEIEDCGEYYSIRVGGDLPEGCCPGGGGTVLGTPRRESTTLGEVKKEFTK